MKNLNKFKIKLFFSILFLEIIIPNQALAASPVGLGSVDNFLKTIIQAIAGLAGLVATGFFVIGGFIYITSTGNPIKLEKAKKTLLYSGLGLAITIAAFVLSNIVTQLATSAFGG